MIALVMLWTGFPAAFAAIFTTLFVPLSVAALGIVLRGAGLRVPRSDPAGAVAGGRRRHLRSRLAADPVLPGTVVGSVVTGRVRGTSGDPVGSWVNPTSLLTGALFVAVSAYLAAVYLVVDSENAGEPELRRYFTRRALAAGVASGVLAGVTMAVLQTTAKPVFTELTRGRGLPLVVISVPAGVAVLIPLIRDIPRAGPADGGYRGRGSDLGWALAQYPYCSRPG